MKGIVKRGVTPTDPSNTIDFRIFCKPNLTRSLIMRNSTAPITPKETTTNVVYKFSCQEGRCDGSNNYIGRTSTTLLCRSQSHRNQGSIFQHYTDVHSMKPPLQTLLDHTEIIHREKDFRKLQISEAVSITCQKPSINIQQAADFILPSARQQGRNNSTIHVIQQQHNSTYPPNHHIGPVTRSRGRASTLLQDQEYNTPTNHRTPLAPSQPMAVQHMQPTRAQLRGLSPHPGPR